MEPSLPVLIYPEDETPREWGQRHGARFSEAIAALVARRIELSMSVGVFTTPEAVLEVARAHLPLLEAYDAALYEELVGIAEGAGLEPEAIVVLNHYTDLRDIDPAILPGSDEGCTAIFARTPTTTLLGMTWDTHGDATDYTCVLGIPPRGKAPGAWALTIVGCLGMTGLNAAGHGVVINNLKSTDARLGVVWPAIIRRQLRERRTAGGLRVLESTLLGSGHHYLMGDASGHGVGVETSGQRVAIVYRGDPGSFLHTNHCLSPEIEEVSLVAPTSTTHVRYDRMSESMSARGLEDLEDLWSRFELVSYDRDVEAPGGVATCAALAMDLGGRRALATRGPVGRGAPRASLGFNDAGAPILIE